MSIGATTTTTTTLNTSDTPGSSVTSWFESTSTVEKSTTMPLSNHNGVKKSSASSHDDVSVASGNKDIFITAIGKFVMESVVCLLFVVSSLFVYLFFCLLLHRCYNVSFLFKVSIGGTITTTFVIIKLMGFWKNRHTTNSLVTRPKTLSKDKYTDNESDDGEL